MEPKVVLVNWTPRPIETMLFAYKNMHGQLPDSLDELCRTLPSGLRQDFMQYLPAESLSGGVQEFVSTVWLFKGVSRAFQEQLTRHRTAAYSIQSLRIVPKDEFATNEDYHIPKNTKMPLSFHNAMLDIEERYAALVGDGEITEVARGILPLNICSPITMCINLRALGGLISARLCHMAQGEFRDVAQLMIEEVCTKMGEEFRGLFAEPCLYSGTCPHADGCGWRPKLDSVEGRNTPAMKAWVRSQGK